MENRGRSAFVPRTPKTSAGGAGGTSPPTSTTRGPRRTPRAKKPSSEAAPPAAAAEQDHEVDESGALASGDERDEADEPDEVDGAPASVTGGAADSEPAIATEDPFAEEGEATEEVDGHAVVALSRELARGAGSSMERLDPMAAYLREIQRHPLLTPEETHALATQFVTTQDPAVAARLVTANLRLVVKIAYEYRRAYKNIMDLVQEGNIGLMQAVKRYDPYRGVKLSSYAAWWIRAYILRFILNNWRLVKLGTTQAQRKLFFNLRKKRSELVAMGIDPSNAEIARQLNVPESDVAEMDVRLAQSEKSLDAPVGDADGRSIAKVDMMPHVGAGPETQMADNELQALVKQKLDEFRVTLVGKEKDVAIFDLRLRADDPLTLQDLGDRFGISRERVRQLEQRLLGRLRDYLKREMGDATDSL
jgi:RNA polymerase sigma-32 factor